MSTTSSIVRFDLGDREVPLTIKRSHQARVLRLRTDPASGGLVLTLPRRASERRALEWAASQRPWAVGALAGLTPPIPLVPGEVIPFHGDPHRIEWHAEARRGVSMEPGKLIVGGPQELVASRLERWLRGHARTLLEAETRELAGRNGLSVTSVRVGDTRSRWGSCSGSGAIRYSWRLVLAPSWVRQATVAHEVAHLVHMNHAPAFHRLVEELFGADPTPARLWLRRNGAALHAVGRGGGPLAR